RVRPGPNGLGYSYRIDDPSAWKTWLSRVSKQPAEELEVVQRTLRVRDHAVPAKVAAVAQDARPAPQNPPQVADVKPVAPVKPGLEKDPVKEQILVLFAEKTGYPVDMLALDLDLEADL